MSDRREHDDTFEEPDEHGAEAADDALTRPQPTASRGATARAAREDGVITAGRSARERRRRVLTTFLVVVLGAISRTSSIVTTCRPLRRAHALEALIKWIIARELTPSSTPGMSRVRRPSATM